MLSGIARTPRRRVMASAGVLLFVALALIVVASRSGTASANPLTGVDGVSTGEFRTCFLTSTGTVKCAGDDYGAVAADVAGLSGVMQVSSAFQYVCALTASGGVKCWQDTYGATPVDISGYTSGVSRISSGGYHTCALSAGGAAGCWGNNQHGQLGDGSLTSGVIDVGTGVYHTCAAMSGGGVKCWGRNSSGQLGNGGTADSTAPVDVIGLSGAVAVDGAKNFSCALTSAGGVKCWGLGYGSAPADVPGLTSGVAAISLGHLHACALTTAGAVKCWSDNAYGQLGDGLACGPVCGIPVQPVGLTAGVASVTAGAYRSCAAMTDGTARCWGANFQGALGSGDFITATTPVTVVDTVWKPAPTPTPCPGACPTPTPTPSGPPLTGLDWSIGVDLDGDGTYECSTRDGGSPECYVVSGVPFSVTASLDALSAADPEWIGYDVVMGYAGVASSNAVQVLWPECTDPAFAYPPGTIAHGCGLFGGFYTTDYVGPIASNAFTCSGPGTVSLKHGNGKTGLLLQSFAYEYEGNPSSEVLTINCLAPLADEDGDGCTNAQEVSAFPTNGGKRNPVNPWDYFNPTYDGLNRTDDILAVVRQYAVDGGQEGYTTGTDRMDLGADAWDLGPPDGRQRTDDILASVGQFYHDC